jgi:hypothetical protein
MALNASVDREQVLAFRLSTHNLAERLPDGSLLAAAGVCSVQNTPPGAAALALHARVAGVMPRDVEHALVEERTLLQAWSLRAAPHLFPIAAARIYTLGLLPADEPALRFFLGGAEAALTRIDVAATAIVELTAAALHEALDREAMTKDQLGVELAKRVAGRLRPSQSAAWHSPSWYAPRQSLGESMVRFALPVVALRGECCHGARRGKDALLVRTDRWLGAPLPASTPEVVQAELVRCYLHAYGPSTVEHLAAWAGIAPAQAGEAWRLVGGELAKVDQAGRAAWLLRRDLATLASPPPAGGVRFLPAHDPFLQLRDHATLIPDRAVQRRVWRSAGSPGVVLASGRAVATWRSRKQGKRLLLSVEPFAPLSPGARVEIEEEAEGLGPFWGREAVQVAFESSQ